MCSSDLRVALFGPVERENRDAVAHLEVDIVGGKRRHDLDSLVRLHRTRGVSIRGGVCGVNFARKTK